MAKEKLPIELRNVTRRIITLPNSKQMLEIRKISLREYNQLTGGVDLTGLEEIKLDDPERRKKIEEILRARYNSLPVEEKKEYDRKSTLDTNKLIIAAVVDPKIDYEASENVIGINELDDTDYGYLANQINDLSWGRGQDLKPFRIEPVTGNN